MTRNIEGSTSGCNFEVHRVAATGTTAVEIRTKFSKIFWAGYTWAEEPDNATYQLYTYSRSGGILNFKCTHATTKDVDVLILGYT